MQWKNDTTLQSRGQSRECIHAIPAIPVCAVRFKGGHSANARVYEYAP
jgi:hypothetical protein